MAKEQIYAAVLHKIGETPRYELFPAPVAADGDAVITVTAAALKPSDRWMAKGIHYAPTTFPAVVGLDGVGQLEDGTRVAFMIPKQPYGGMAEQTLVRRGMWLPVPDGVDDVSAAAFANPGMAAWKTMAWEGELSAGQSVLILGATGTSGRIAAQIAKKLGARVVVAGRNRRVLDELLKREADAKIDLNQQHDVIAAQIATSGPYDLIADYLWGAPAEAVFAAFARHVKRTDGGPEKIRYIIVGIAAGESANIPAIALRRAPIHMFGSGTGKSASLAESAAAFSSLLKQVAAGEITVDLEAVPLAEVEKRWSQTDTDRRIVFVP